MDERRESEATATKNHTTVERKSELELVVTRTVNASCAPRVRGVDQGRTIQEVVGTKVVWADPAVLRNGCSRWGQYRLVFRHEDSTMEFFGTYLEVTPHSRLVWTNEEGDNGKTITTVTFEENAGKTLLVVHDLYPSKEALDSGSTGAMPEALDQLDELLASLGSSTETK